MSSCSHRTPVRVRVSRKGGKGRAGPVPAPRFWARVIRFGSYSRVRVGVSGCAQLRLCLPVGTEGGAAQAKERDSRVTRGNGRTARSEVD
jgi:hypothetical protein